MAAVLAAGITDELLARARDKITWILRANGADQIWQGQIGQALELDFTDAQEEEPAVRERHGDLVNRRDSHLWDVQNSEERGIPGERESAHQGHKRHNDADKGGEPANDTQPHRNPRVPLAASAQ